MESPSERPDKKAADASPKRETAQDKNADAKSDLPTVDPLAKSNTPPADSNPDHTNNKEHTAGEWRKNSIKRALFIIECLGIIGLAYYCRVNYLEWKTFDSERITMESEFQVTQTNIINQTEETRLDERAWVSPIVTPNFQTPSDNNGSSSIGISYINTGKTPALKIITVINWTTNLNQIPIADGMPSIRSGLLAPTQSGYTPSAPIPAQFFAGIANGTPIYVYGTIWYDDIFRKSHWSKFCYRIERFSDNKALLHFIEPPIHNSCDDE